MRRLLARWLYGRRNGMQRRTMSWPLALLLVLGLHAGAAVLLLGLTFNNSAEVYYPTDAPAVMLRDELRRDFPSDEVLTVLFRGDDLYSPEFLQRLHGMAAIIERHPLVDRVTTVTSFERISGTEDEFVVDLLVDVERLQGQSPEALRERVLADRFAPGLLASRDGRHLAMAVRPRPLSESGERLALKIAVAGALQEAGLGPYYAGDAGPVTMDVAQLQSILRDSARFIPLTVLIGLGLLFWVVGRWRPVAIGGLAMSTVVLPTIAVIAAAGQPYTMASAILPSLLAAYTVATLLHLYAGIQRAQRSANGRAQAIDRALAETRRPSAYNVLTTGAGLLSLLLVPIPPIQVFGVVGALGTLVVFLTVYVLMPPLLLNWDRGRWPQRSSGMGRLGAVARRVTLSSMRYPKTVVVGFGALVVALFPYAQQVQIETDMLAFFAPAHPINVDTRLVESKLAGVTTLEISLRADARDAFQTADTLRSVKALQDWLSARPEVDRAISMVDLVEEMHWAMNRERPEFRTLPGNDRLLRQYLLIYDGQDLYELVNRDFDHARIVLNLNVHGMRAISDSIEDIQAYLAAQPVPGVQVDVGGYGRLVADQVELLVSGQMYSFAGAFGQIFVIMAILFRSLRSAAVCIVPNLAPLFFVFVLMGATGLSLDLATVMIASVVLGITIDDTIHLFHGYRQRLQAGTQPLLAIIRSYDAAGRAVLATSAVLVAQFGLLTTSDFIPTSSFGLLTAAGLVAGLLLELLLLPALLVLMHTGLNGFRSGRSVLFQRWRSRPTNVPGETAWAPTLVLQRNLDTEDRATPHSTPSAPASNMQDHSQEQARSDAAPRRTTRFLVCVGPACIDAGAESLWSTMQALQRSRMAHPESIAPVRVECLGSCGGAPVVEVLNLSTRRTACTSAWLIDTAFSTTTPSTEETATFPKSTKSSPEPQTGR